MTNSTWDPISWDSTREEVLAAVAAHEARTAAIHRDLAEMELPTLDPENPREGCHWSADGNVVLCYRGPSHNDTDPHLVRQRAAGEENQDDGTWAIGLEPRGPPARACRDR